MADKMMRIAGRTSGGTAVPMLADANGNIATTRTWKKEWVSLLAATAVTDANAHDVTAYDVSGIPMFSLRVCNRTGVDVTLSFKTDVNTSNGYTLCDADQADYAITIASSSRYTIITPEDLPILNYIKYLRIVYKAASTPSSGTLEINMVTIK